MNEVLRRMASLALTTGAPSRGCLSRKSCPSFSTSVMFSRGCGHHQSAHSQVIAPVALSTFSTVSERSSSLRWTLCYNDPVSRSGAPTSSYHQFSTQVQTDESTPTAATPTIATDDSGQQYGMLLDTRKLPKLKPSIVKRRIDKLHTYVGQEKGIRHSPWKLNRVCQLAAGLTLEDALTQLQFCDKKNAPLVSKVLKRTSNLADIRHGIQISQLEVVECFATPAFRLKRIKMMGRGRYVFDTLTSSLDENSRTSTIC